VSRPRWSALVRLTTLLCLIIGASWLVGTPTAVAADPPLASSENELKAAFLINFPKYVEWPSTGSATNAGPIVLAVFGESTLDEELRKAIKGKVVNGRPLVFKRALTEEECSKGCHLVFIGAEERRRLPSLLNRLKEMSVLTVGESDDFLENGGIIKLVRWDRKIRFEVNLAAARRARLEISSKLLNVASVVQGKLK
jgi:hypothetical protein